MTTVAPLAGTEVADRSDPAQADTYAHALEELAAVCTPDVKVVVIGEGPARPGHRARRRGAALLRGAVGGRDRRRGRRADRVLGDREQVLRLHLRHQQMRAVGLVSGEPAAVEGRGRADAGFVPSAIMADYYRQRASAGLIISEATGISREGLGWPFAPGTGFM